MPAEVSREEVYQALKTVYDPEIPVNVVDLGLIYDVQVADNNNVFVQMTLTFPGCGMGPHIAQQAEWAVQDLDGVEDVEIELTFDPPWSPEMISEGEADSSFLEQWAANATCKQYRAARFTQNPGDGAG
jgi:metal-sulfur cluster biosynthetic enzyme